MKCNTNVNSSFICECACGPHFVAGLKRAEDATTVEEIKKLYEAQYKRK